MKKSNLIEQIKGWLGFPFALALFFGWTSIAITVASAVAPEEEFARDAIGLGIGFGLPILVVAWFAKQKKRYREAVEAAYTLGWKHGRDGKAYSPNAPYYTRDLPTFVKHNYPSVEDPSGMD